MEEDHGFVVSLDLPFEQAVVRTRVCMRARGFSILSEMPVPPEVGGEGRRHLFLGMWTRVTSVDNLGGPGLEVGDHLACNLVVFESDGATQVAALSVREGLTGWDDPVMAGEAEQSLKDLLEVIGEPSED
ncbi:MAG: hypothetical protein ACRDI1_02945 [Actinomycetota bacterium]